MLLTRPPSPTDHAARADEITGIALLNCLVREICVPEEQVWWQGGHLVVRLPRAGVRLRARLARPPAGPTYRLTGPIEESRRAGWTLVGWRRLADLAAGELELLTGLANPEFTGQVRESRRAVAALLAARANGEPPSEDRYLESERSLVAGHRFHPTPKARDGDPAEWLRYAPEARARFAMRWLGVRDDLVAQDGDPAALAALESLGPVPPPGHRLLPVHPWQLALLADRPLLRRALAEGSVVDLGAAGPEAVPTSSVRTVYVPGADLFCKFSLDVRITNCVRKNAWYELAGSVALGPLLRPALDDLGARFSGCRLLAEPAYRTVALADRRLYEGLGVILREGIGGCAGTPLLAAALAEDPAAVLPTPALATPDGALEWWRGYVDKVAPPVLHALLRYGIVLEPHLQNVLIAVDQAGMPVQAVFRDLEGTKLIAHRWELGHLPSRVRASLTYNADRGWSRVVYCLFVNNLAEVCGAIADRHPSLEPELWRRAHRVLSRYAREAELPPGPAGRLRALLAGVPLTAKANLRARWARQADRAATYVPVPSPFRPAAGRLSGLPT